MLAGLNADGLPLRYLDRALSWIERHAAALWAALILAAVMLRALLVVLSPRPDGYTFDFYYQGVEVLNSTGRLPRAEDCWQCYHPPLFYMLGALFYRGAWLLSGTRSGALAGLSVLSLASTALATYYSIQLLRQLTPRRSILLLASAVVLVFPCLFISSWSAEADSLQTGLMVAVAYYVTRYDTQAQSSSLQLVIVIGTLCGLAMATKYNGLLALAAAGIVLFLRLFQQPSPRRTIRDGLIILMLACGIGGWRYVENYVHRGTPLFANGPAAQGFSVRGFSHRRDYDFVSFRPGDVIDLYPPGAPAGRLTDQDVYSSVLTTLHAMAWTDMSFFSVPSRHGDPSQPYPAKAVPRWLVGAMLFLGLVPSLLAAIGVVFSLRHRSLRACSILAVLTMVSYVSWFTAQDAWALKTKYILFLLPAYAGYVVVGLEMVSRPRAAAVGGLLIIGLLALLVVAHFYLLAFATGSLLRF